MSASAAPAERRFYAAACFLPLGARGWWAFSASTGLVAILLLVLPGAKRYRAALTLGIVCVLGFTLAATSYNNGGGGGPVATTPLCPLLPRPNATKRHHHHNSYCRRGRAGLAILNDSAAGTNTQVL